MVGYEFTKVNFELDFGIAFIYVLPAVSGGAGEFFVAEFFEVVEVEHLVFNILTYFRLFAKSARCGGLQAYTN